MLVLVKHARLHPSRLQISTSKHHGKIWPCYNFLQGLLRYNNVCFYNVLGACKNGQRCPFRHLTPAEVKQLLAPRPPSHNHHHHHTHNINSSNSNVTSKKHYDAEQLYKAAGILPYCVQPESKQVLVLLGKDQRKSGQVWSEFGGKRDEKDATSVTTGIYIILVFFLLFSGASIL